MQRTNLTSGASTPGDSPIGASTPVPAEPAGPSATLSIVLTILLGLMSGISGVLWHTHYWAGTMNETLIVLPWGAVLSALAVLAAGLWWGSFTGRLWVPGAIGAIAFATIGVLSLSTTNIVIAPINEFTRNNAPGAYIAALTLFAGVILATVLASLAVMKILSRRQREARATQMRGEAHAAAAEAEQA